MTDLEQEQGPRSVAAGRRTLVVGLLADPDTPAEVAAKLVDDLPGELGARVDSGTTWVVRTITHPVTASVQDPEEVLGAVADQTAHTEWDIGIYLTDLPMQHGDHRSWSTSTTTAASPGSHFPASARSCSTTRSATQSLA
jgi:hypothetical protein